MPTEPNPALGRYLAKLPYIVGHQLSDDQIVAGFFGPDGAGIAHGAVSGDQDAAPQQLTEYFARALENAGPIDHVAVVGYGPEGGTRAVDLATALCETFDARSTVLHVQDGSWRVLDSLTETWGSNSILPAPPPDFVIHGSPTPAASRDDLVTSVKPLEGPLFTELDHAKAKYLTTLSPATQAYLARTALDQLARNRIDSVAHQQSLAQLVNASIIVRDAVLGHAVHGPRRRQRVDALIRTFRAAPPSQRPALAATAAAAAYLAGWHSPQVEGLLRHTDPAHRLADLVRHAHHHGINPEPMRRTIIKAADSQLADAETAWTTNETAKNATRTKEPSSGAGAPRSQQPRSSDAMGI